MKQQGQVLVSVLIVIAVAVLATGVAVVANSISRNIGLNSSSNRLFYAAESGVDDTIIKLLRNPNLTMVNETVNVGKVPVTISITHPTPTKVLISSEASEGGITRKVEVSTEFVNNILTVNSWKQVP